MKTLATIAVIVLVYVGARYYFQHKTATDASIVSVDTTITAAAEKSADAAVSGALKSVSPVSLAYYGANRNYGTSATDNICVDTTSSGSVGAVIGTIQKYTQAISCAVDQAFPAKSFTITAASAAHKGEYFCIDQNGAVDLIPALSSKNGFVAGISCK